mgnify:FL=1|tara:strand:+ start:21742 stop:23721 length:1980 start_codon:yes stop_codon:yes gene_type:complete
MSRALVLCLFLLMQINIFAIQQDTLNLDEVVLKSSLINQTNPALSVSQISYKQNEIKPINFQEAIDFSAGLWITNSENQAQDNRMSIRGFGARSAFGIRGVKIILDGIPLTTPDGQSQVDNIPFDLIESIEVLKSLSSTRYGNASGGVVTINTFSEHKAKILIGTSFGSHNLKKTKGTYSISKANSTTIINVSKSESDGYREHSSYLNKSAFFKHIRNFQKLKVKFNILFFDSPYAYDPGGLTIESVDEDRSQARDQNVLYNSQESVKQLQTGLVLDWNTNIGQISSNIYYSNRDFVGLLPFTYGGYVELNRDFSGAEFSLKNRFENIEWIIGSSIQSQSDDRKRFENNEGVKGSRTLDQIESFKSYGAFALASYSKENYSIQSGLRLDLHKISLDDNIGIDQQYVDYSKSLKAFSPNIGLIYNINKNDEVYINHGKSYETPSLSELSANPSGAGFNEDLSPMISSGFDIGFRKKSQNLSYSIAAFYIDTKDEIVRYELEGFEGMNFYRNLGTSKRVGAELEASYNLGSPGKLKASYTQAKYEFKNQGLSGNLAGIPKSNFAFEWLYGHKDFDLKLDLKYANSLFADNNNEVKVPSYLLSNIAMKNKFNFNSFYIEVGLHVRNLLDEKYYDNIRTNAFGNRFYEPASLRRFIFSINANF